MISRAGFRWLLICVLAAPLAVPSAEAARSPMARQAGEPQGFVRPAGISMEQAASMVQRRTGGQVLSTTRVERGGREGYEVRVLVDGKRVRKMFVDGQGNIRGAD